jgi:hypothetical protein
MVGYGGDPHKDMYEWNSTTSASRRLTLQGMGTRIFKGGMKSCDEYASKTPRASGFRWLTVAPKGQADLEIILMKIGVGGDFGKMKDFDAGESTKKDVEAMAALLKKGWFIQC